MNYGGEGLSASDIAVLTGRTGGNDGNSNGWGDNGSWWIIIFLIFAMTGWGRNGFGGGNYGGGNDGGYGFGGYGFGWNPCCAPATQQGLSDAFNFNNLDNGIRGIQNGLCDGFYGVNTSILNLGQTLLQCCCDVKGAIAENGWQTRDAINMNSTAIQSSLCNGFNGVQRGFADLGYKLQDCCCTTQRSIDNVRFDMAQLGCGINNSINNSTRDILESNNANTRAILDFLTKDKIDTLQAENQALKFQASQSAQNNFIAANQDAQTAELIRRLGADCPVPAYVVPNPNCCYPAQVTFGNNGCNNGCGCY